MNPICRRSIRQASFAVILLTLVTGTLFIWTAGARNPIRNAFFGLYPVAENTQLDDLPSNAGHCGVCHFDFDGGGPRNPYGLGVETGIGNGLSNTDAILAIESTDSDADGFINLIEITEVNAFGNTPTFPGLAESNYGNIVNIPPVEVEPYLTPSGGNDTTPPVVTLTSPNGGEVLNADSYFAISFSASDDESGLSHFNVYLSDDQGATYKPVAKNEPYGSGFSWFIPNRPETANRIKVEVYDIAGNSGEDVSDADFTIIARPPGYVPTTLRDVDMSGTQPFEGAVLADPDQSCATCHGNYDSDNEPWFTWRGSMMAQAARDPFYFACMAIAEQDAPSSGDLCIRCHSPGGWQGGRSVDTSGDLLTVVDRHGVQCDFCHRLVDHNYVEGVSPPQDVEVLETVDPLPLQYGNGEFINDPSPLMRGPYADADASHAFVESPFHRSANACGICHDVSNPVFVRTGPLDYAPNGFDEQHPDLDVRNMGPVERTFSEWSQSEYAAIGVYAPQFAGDKPDGIVSTCQDCHLRDVTAKGCNEPGAPTRTDLGLHDLMGGNTFVPDIIATFFPDEVDVAQLLAAKQRATVMLQLAATLEATATPAGISVRVTNETGHKLPSGYPEGRRIWINVQAFDANEQLVFESGAYDFDAADLHHDDQAKIYEIHGGLSPPLAAALGLPAGKSFHFVLNDSVYADNRIPPRGFTYAAFEQVQSPPVAHTYADGQYWDDTGYVLPAEAENAVVTLYYQSTSKEYIEFLRDENTTNSAGQDLYNAWVAQGKAPPVVMAQVMVPVDIVVGATFDQIDPLVYSLRQNEPNPFNPNTTIHFSMKERGEVAITVYDVGGSRVRTLFDGIKDAGHHALVWNGVGDGGEKVPSGVYFIHYSAAGKQYWKKALLSR